MNTLGRPPESGHSLTPGSRRILVIVGTGLAICFVAYVLFSGKAVTGVAEASGARPKSTFTALWFADPAVASRGVPRGEPVSIAVSNQTRGARTVRWSTSSSGATLEESSLRLARSSTKTFVVSTRDARAGEWFSVRLDGTSIAIKTMVTP